MRIKLFSTALFSFLVVQVIAQQGINGTYVLQQKEMVSGTEYLNAIAKQITITKTKDSLIIERITPGGGGNDVASREALSLDGKNLVRTTSTNRRRTSLLTVDKAGKLLKLITIISYPEKPDEAEYKNTEEWAFGDDGTLTIVKTSDATATDDWTIRAVFKKQ